MIKSKRDNNTWLINLQQLLIIQAREERVNLDPYSAKRRLLLSGAISHIVSIIAQVSNINYAAMTFQLCYFACE